MTAHDPATYLRCHNKLTNTLNYILWRIMYFRITNVIEYRINKIDEKFDYTWEKLSKPSIFSFNGSDGTSPLITVIGGQVYVFHSDSNANSISFKISTEHIAVEDMEEFEINI